MSRSACMSIVFFPLRHFIIAAPATGGYHLIKKVPLGAAEGGGEYFDYINVDATARRAYLSHGTDFLVVDADKGTVLGKISGFISVFEVVINHPLAIGDPLLWGSAEGNRCNYRSLSGLDHRGALWLAIEYEDAL